MTIKEEKVEKDIWFGTLLNAELFKKHLTVDNKRIIFSAPFGTGKSTFLDKFFNDNKDFNVVSISPVHYSIPDNKDVYDLMKYDILCELLNDEVEIPDENPLSFTGNLIFNKKVLFQNIIKNIPKVGKQLDVFLKSISEVYDVLEESNKSELTKMKGLVELLEESNYILDLDEVTKICNVLLERSSGSKRKVLIIDDLDRIDPEHIFRLLNVFCANVDNRYGVSKFDFDHVIFVCDIDNIRKIYEHRYGANVDFGGYIDKFCSKDIFDFNLVAEIDRTFEDQFLSFGQAGISNYKFSNCLYIIIHLMLKHRMLSFRDMHYMYELLKQEKNLNLPLNIYDNFIESSRKCGFSTCFISKIRSEHEKIELELKVGTKEYYLWVFMLDLVTNSRVNRTYLDKEYIINQLDHKFLIEGNNEFIFTVNNHSLKIDSTYESVDIKIFAFKILKKIFDN
ncbi:MAG: P-loop NTPase fold protein [Marinifilaceae bacterium]